MSCPPARPAPPGCAVARGVGAALAGRVASAALNASTRMDPAAVATSSQRRRAARIRRFLGGLTPRLLIRGLP
ncbi:MAG TPA: hypothetical protein VF060_14165 [Trebonia sp.]